MTSLGSGSQISQGELESGPEANALIERTSDFIYVQLAQWRDRPNRIAETDEEKLNAQLNRHLNACARQAGFPVQFQHEEKQEARRRVDMAVTPVDFGGTIVGKTYYGFDDPFLVLEGKRLPSPGGRTRRREYVTGEPQITGGIQRFKLGLHGGKLSTAILIGYVQADSFTLWHRRINTWIRALARRRRVGRAEVWDVLEVLSVITTAPDNTSRCSSEHSRVNGSAAIHLDHMWVKM